MLNIVVPMAGKSFFFDENKDGFVKPFIEICGKTMLEWFIESFYSVKDKHFIFVLKEEDIFAHGLDEAIMVLTQGQSEIVSLKNETMGMVCSAMMAIDSINDENPLLLVNYDQIFTLNLNEKLKEFEGFDAGVLTFDSIHPRYAYVKCEKNLVVQAFEKKPVSRQAVAGFYYFSKGELFMEVAKSAIRKESHYQGKYFPSLLLNELVLQNKKVIALNIDKNCYHTFYSFKKIEEYERMKNA